MKQNRTEFRFICNEYAFNCWSATSRILLPKQVNHTANLFQTCERIAIQTLLFLACGLVGVRFSLTGRESREECWNYIAGPTRTIKSRGGKSHNEWTPLSMLQRATRGLVWPVWTRTNRCHVLCGETKGCARTKPHKATDINPYTVPLHWLLYAYVRPSDPLTVKSATSQTAAFKQIKRQKCVKYSKEKGSIWKFNCRIAKRMVSNTAGVRAVYTCMQCRLYLDTELFLLRKSCLYVP